jgi:hypothetical protein
MPDLSTQLREYFDATASPVEVEEVMSDDPWVPSRRKTQTIRWIAPGWAYGAAAMAVLLVLILGLALLRAEGNENEVVQPPPTTMVPDVETMTDLQIIEAGVAALYSGDAERAVELFGTELISQQSAYQAAVGGRLTLNCTEVVNTPGMFTCNVPYHNALTDAVGYVDDPGDSIQVLVQDGVITKFGLPGHLAQGVAHEFPRHDFILRTVVSFLKEEVEGSEGCWVLGAMRTLECARLIMDHLDDWAAWYESNG